MGEDAYKIVKLPSGHFRAERLLRDGNAVSYQSAAFTRHQEAQQWIALQQQDSTQSVTLQYVITPTDVGTSRVSLWHRNRIEELGEIDTETQPKAFAQRMQEYLALVTNLALAPVAEFMANHVVGIEIRHFLFAQGAAALAWLRSA
jgi:hypothetical protein